jgi:hypothetical protein
MAKNLPIEVGIAPTNKEWTILVRISAKSDSMTKISQHFAEESSNLCKYKQSHDVTCY